MRLAQQAEAQSRLARYDIGGVTRCLAPDVLRELEVRLRWAPDAPADARVRAMGPDGRPLHMKLEKLYEAAWSERKTLAAQQQPAIASGSSLDGLDEVVLMGPAASYSQDAARLVCLQAPQAMQPQLTRVMQPPNLGAQSKRESLRPGT